MNLVIVESPTKAKTISKFLGSQYKVESSFGHIRDLPEKEMGIDIENNFEPKYVIPDKSQKIATKLKTLAKNADKIILASDEDREGEAISWHLKNILNPKNYQRITFHEITKSAIEESLKHPREIDMNLVDAQQARRVLDRLVGYELSPFLWRKVAKGLSAGRVQSVAVRLVVEREREIESFKKQEYWTIEATFGSEQDKLLAELHAQNGKTLKKFDIKNKEQADELVAEIQKEKYHVASIETKETKKKPPEPFRTSTLQQDASNKLGFSAKETMMLAQQLYEGIDLKDARGTVGLITYMRTDSLNLSKEFLSACHDFIIEQYGADYAPKAPKYYKTKSAGAQEAHEAVRCTHVNFTPDSVSGALSDKQLRLYTLIWSRSVACQMTEAIYESVSVDINSEGDKYSFRATGQTMKFPGFQKVYKTDSKEVLIPHLEKGQDLNLEKIDPKQHFTEPPARYTEASLIKTLEEYGIGRPSTYAPTLATIQDRNYVVKEEKKFKPTDIGILVNDILFEHFNNIVDYQFTAKMEHDLDEVADGKIKWQPIIKEFYGPFKENLTKKNVELKKKTLTEEKTDQVCEKCGSPMVIKTGRYGRFYACSNYPECKNTKNIAKEVVPGETPTESQEENKLEEKCPECGSALQIKRGKFGKFIGCSNYPNCKYIKSFSQKTGIACPECKTGEIVSRKGRRGIFYGCSKYPNCKFTLWGKPTGEKCPKCSSLLVYGPKETIKCSKKDCDYKT